MTNRRVVVFGPAYLDRVVRVDRPLIDPAHGPPIDQSVDGEWKFAQSRRLELVDPSGYTLGVELPVDWPGPTGEVRLSRPLRAGAHGRRVVRGLNWQDDLGGMGAGYAAALHGTLRSALGPETDPTSQVISRKLALHAVPHHPIRVPDHAADWTLLISSGVFGDKLPIGFRGCHAALDPESLDPFAAEPCDLRVVAALPNRLATRLLRPPGAGVRLFAPAMRSMLDRDCAISSFAASIDVLCCNRVEWETLEDRETAGWQLSILAVTDGPAGSTVRFTTPAGDSGLLRIPAFPRSRPPRDTNRAGETYAATLITTLLDQGWRADLGVVEESLMRLAAERAAAAAALVLDRVEFGFPTPAEVDSALALGRIT
jgi:sugar/nucleoside kinase (ribokinase family)